VVIRVGWGRRLARRRRAARAGRRKRARRLCLRQVRIGVVRVRSVRAVRATLGTAAFGTQGVWHGKGPSPFQGPALVLPRARLTCARRPLPSLPKAGRAPRRRAICSSHRLARAARQARVRPNWSGARTCGSSWFFTRASRPSHPAATSSASSASSFVRRASALPSESARPPARRRPGLGWHCPGARP